MRDAVVVSLLSLVPRRKASWGMGRVARSGASRALVRTFVRAYGVDLGEAEHGLEAYPTLDAFFTRRLRPGARPIDGAPDALVSPVDGACAWAGRTEGGRLQAAPGRWVDAAALLGTSVDGERDAVVLYLSPKDYHRVHVPREGVLRAWRYVPGTLWPVFPAAVRQVDGLFARNERAVLHLTTDAGPLDVVMVGAFGVGRIEVPAVGLGTNDGAPAAEAACAVELARGADLGVFHLGSTVVLLAPPGAWSWSVQAGQTVRVGQALGHRG